MKTEQHLLEEAAEINRHLRVVEAKLERDWCPACGGTGNITGVVAGAHGYAPCHFCQFTGRVWKQDADAWKVRYKKEGK